MRTTVDLTPAVHRRVRELAERRGQSVAAVLMDLTVRGLAQLDEPVRLTVDRRSGLPVVSIGRKVTFDDVANALDDE